MPFSITALKPSNMYSYISGRVGLSTLPVSNAPVTISTPHLLKQKTEKSFSLLYDQYAGALFSIILRMVMNKEIAEDLLQEAFIKIWKNSHLYDESKGTPYTWMLNITRNTCIDFIRLRKNNFYKNMLSSDVVENENRHPSFFAEYVDRLDYIAVKSKTALLEKKYAEVIDLIYFEGCTQEQAATILDLPLGTIKTRARHALTILKNRCK